MSLENLTKKMSPEQTKRAFKRVGMAGLICGVLTLYIEHVAKTTMYMNGIEHFLYSFLTFGTTPIWLKEIRNYAYLWFGVGMVIYICGLRYSVEEAKEEQRIIDEYFAEKNAAESKKSESVVKK